MDICDFCGRESEDGRYTDAGFECDTCMDNEEAKWRAAYQGRPQEIVEVFDWDEWDNIINRDDVSETGRTEDDAFISYVIMEDGTEFVACADIISDLYAGLEVARDQENDYRYA